MISITNKKHWILEQAETIPQNTAIVTNEITLSYNAFWEKCKSTASFFESRGIKARINVGILFSHHYKLFEVVNSLWMIGAVPVPLNNRHNLDELNYQIKLAEINFLIVDSSLQNSFNIHQLKAAIILLNPAGQEQNDFNQSKLYTQRPEFNTLSSSLILFTSGSGGKPKAVVHNFQSLLENVKALDAFANLSSSDIWLSSLPAYHIGGLMIFIRSLIAGSMVSVPSSLKYEDVVSSLKKFKPTHMSLVPTVLKKLVEENIQPESNLEYVFLGGGPSDVTLCIEAYKKGWKIVKVYGSTETCSMVTALDSNDILQKPASSGKPLGKNIIKIIRSRESRVMPNNETNNDREDNFASEDVGEIFVSSAGNFIGYYNDEIFTKEKLKDGYYRTGDFGRIDGSGYLFIESRREDLIITGGENVSAVEVAAFINSHPLVKDCYVFGIPDNTWGQILCAAVTSKNLAENELRLFLSEKTAGYKIPKRIYFVDEIPKTGIGKVNREQLLQKLNLSST